MEKMVKKEIIKCNRVAVLSDIHSNFYALESCVRDAKANSVDAYVFLGDYVSGLASPIKTMDLIYQLQEEYPTICIRGNRERYMMNQGSGQDAYSIGSYTGSWLYTYEKLRECDLRFFENISIFTEIEINGVRMEIAHAKKDNDRFYFEKGDEHIDDIFCEMSTRYLLTGHSHKQYVCCEQDKMIINPGSVGLPLGKGGCAEYVILDIKNETVASIFRQVPYDAEKVIQEQFQSGLVDYARYWAISDLYIALTGEAYTKRLLGKIYKQADIQEDAIENETLWHDFAEELGMRFTEEEVLEYWRNKINL